MKNKTFKLMLLMVAAMLLFSCEKYNEDADFGVKEANSTLIIRTRVMAVNETDESKISYPVNIYVFSGMLVLKQPRLNQKTLLYH